MKRPIEGCFLCDAGRDPDDPERLVVCRTTHHIVILNRHPYTNGHLMVAPVEHIKEPAEANDDAQQEFWPLVLRAQKVLSERYSPDGFNMGINLGAAAGAGVPGHYHFHLVPRWKGDTNFMTSVGGIRLVPEDLTDVWKTLRANFQTD